MTYVALLRGVNVVGKNKVPMKELAKALLELGCGNVRTYIQSGNVIFRSEDSPSRSWETEISSVIQQSFGLAVPVILRTAREMRALSKANKFVSQGASPEHLHVVFLSKTLGKDVLERADEERFLPDTFRVSQRELYLWVPSGFGTSKLPAYLERRVKATDIKVTTRNWRTTLQLTAMAEELDRS